MSEMHEVTLAPMSKDALSKLRNGNRPCQCRLAGKGQKGPTCIMKMDNLEKLVKGDRKGSASRLVLDRDEIDANKIEGTGIMAGGKATREAKRRRNPVRGGKATSEGDRPRKNRPAKTPAQKLADALGVGLVGGKATSEGDRPRKNRPAKTPAQKVADALGLGLHGGAVAQMPDGSYHVINNHPEPTAAQKRIAERKMKHMHYSDDEPRSTVPVHTIVRKHKGEGLVAGGRASKAKSARCRQAAEDLAECQPWTIAARNREEQPKRGPSKRKNLVIDPAEDPEGPKKGQKVFRRGKVKPMQLSTPKKGMTTRSQTKAGGSGLYGGPRRAHGSGYRGGGPSGGAIGAAERVGNVGAGGNLIGGTRMGHGALASQAQYSNPFFSTQFPPGMQTM